MTKGIPGGGVVVWLLLLLNASQAAVQVTIASVQLMMNVCLLINEPSIIGGSGLTRSRRRQTSRELLRSLHGEKPEAAAETKDCEERLQLTEDTGVGVGGEQTPERDVHQRREAGLVEDRRVCEGLQPPLHVLGQLHFANGDPRDEST